MGQYGRPPQALAGLLVETSCDKVILGKLLNLLEIRNEVSVPLLSHTVAEILNVKNNWVTSLTRRCHVTSLVM